jgi:hypothetical protein
VIDASFDFAPARDLVALDLWEGNLTELPLEGTEPLQVEPRRWWLIVPPARTDAIRGALGERGAIAPFGGGFVVATIAGDWRSLLSVGGFVDKERLREGSVTSTVIHHVPVRIVRGEGEQCQVFLAASYARTLHELWSAAGATPA